MAVTKDLLLSGHNTLVYQHMFDLTDEDLVTKKIITVASGFDCFNAEMNESGNPIISCARNYNYDLAQMREMVEKNLARMQDHLGEHQAQYLLTPGQDIEKVRNRWIRRAKLFLADYEQGKKAGRYRADVLPTLDFPDQRFDFALSSHFLFAHPELSLDSHVDFIKEMARVAKEVRIFPLSNSYGEVSPYLGPVMQALQELHYGEEVRQVSYEFQRGSNAMLRVWATAWPVDARAD